MYTCSRCQYQSRRYFNVHRHEGRIHGIAKKQRECCGEIFLTKGEYYEHCEAIHPEMRSWASISKKKYKMLGNGSLDVKIKLPPIDEYSTSISECETKMIRTRRMSERIKKKTIAALYDRIKPVGTLDLEDVPLVYFQDRPSKITYLKNIYSSDMIKMESDTRTLLGRDLNKVEDFDGKQEMKMKNNGVGTQSQQRMEQTLPLKKLILTKFLNSGFENSECQSDRDAAKNYRETDKAIKKEVERKGLKSELKKRTQEAKKRGKILNRKSNKWNAENIPFNNNNDNGFTLSGWEMKRNKNIFFKIDNNVDWSLATKIHRDYLGSIDFD